MKFSRRNVFLFSSDLAIAALAMLGAHFLKYDSLGTNFGLMFSFLGNDGANTEKAGIVEQADTRCLDR